MLEPAEAAGIGDAPIIGIEAVEELGHDRVNPSSYREMLSMMISASYSRDPLFKGIPA
ncbi:hypothetical protein ACEPUD_15755 [Burkholderia ubonensis]|uniref:hypothetical protein n=1 Tax=Burkholderia ubonensis TaxID=101571 RepID=UPI00358F3CFD